MRRLLCAAAVLTAISCSPKNPPAAPTPTNPVQPAPPPAPPPPPTQIVRLGPSALKYLMHQVVHIEQEFQGMRQPIDFGLRIYFQVVISGPADTVGYPTTITIDSIAPDSGTTVPMGINVGSAKGLAFRGRLTPRGEVRNQVPSDSAAAQALSPIVGWFRNFFPRLPPGGLTLGAAWTDTTTESDRAAGNVTIRSVNRSKAAAWEERNGARALRLEVTSEFTIQGDGQQAGQPFEVSGSGIRNGVDFVAIDGRYLGRQSNDSTTMTISLPIQALTIPRTQVSRTTVTVLP